MTAGWPPGRRLDFACEHAKLAHSRCAPGPRGELDEGRDVMKAKQDRRRRHFWQSPIAAAVTWVGCAAPAIAATTQVDVDVYLHVRVLLSIILGLSVTRLVRGLAGFIQPDVRHRVSLIHLGWVAWALLNVVSFWWWEFRLSTIERWSFALYVFIVVYASMYYFLSVLLFPDDLERYSGYEDFFLSRRVWFFGFVFLTEALDVGDTWIKGVEHLRSLGPEYFVRIGVLLAVCAVGAATRNRRVQAVLVVVALLFEVSFLTRNFLYLT